MVVTCRCCHREERLGAGPEPVVVVPGGARRPPEPVEQAVAGYLAAIALDGAHLVGACPACGMPCSAPAGGGARWSLPPFAFVDDHFELDGRPVAADEVTRRIAVLHPPVREPRSVRWAQIALLLPMLAPLLVWAFLLGFWINYAANMARSP